MPEGKYLTRKEYVEKIGAHQRMKSRVQWDGNDCVPTTVGFTHGDFEDMHSLGFRPRSKVQDVVDASPVLAERNGEVATSDLFLLADNDKTRKRIKKNLIKSEKAWIFYGDNHNSHAIGVLRVDENKLVLCNVEDHDGYLTASEDQIADLLTSYSKVTELGTYIVGFRKK